MGNLPYMPKQTREGWGYTDAAIERDEANYAAAVAAGRREEQKELTRYIPIAEREKGTRGLRVETRHTGKDGRVKRITIGYAHTALERAQMRYEWTMAYRKGDTQAIANARWRLEKEKNKVALVRP